jgi:hypothetical protein
VQTSISTNLIDYSSLQITLTSNPSNVNNGYTTTITAYVTANGASVTGATISFSSNNGGSFGSTAEQGNGYYNVSFNAPSFSATTSCTITASGSKTGYLSAQGTTQLTVVPAPAPTATPTPAPTATPMPTPTSTVNITLATLTFKITDDQGNPLNDTLVTSVIQPTGVQTLLQISNSTGYVSFQNASAGIYTFKIIRQGYPQTNETLDYDGQPLTLSIPLTANIDNNPHANNSPVIVAGIIAATVAAVVVYLLLVKRRKSPNTKNLQQLKKQMENKKKY